MNSNDCKIPLTYILNCNESKQKRAEFESELYVEFVWKYFNVNFDLPLAYVGYNTLLFGCNVI